MKKLILVAMIFLSGCSLLPTKKDVIITDREVRVNPAALVPCAELVSLPKDVNFETVLSVSIANAEIYLDCKRKQDTSITLLKQFSNTKKEE